MNKRVYKSLTLITFSIISLLLTLGQTSAQTAVQNYPIIYATGANVIFRIHYPVKVEPGASFDLVVIAEHIVSVKAYNIFLAFFPSPSSICTIAQPSNIVSFGDLELSQQERREVHFAVLNTAPDGSRCEIRILTTEAYSPQQRLSPDIDVQVSAPVPPTTTQQPTLTLLPLSPSSQTVQGPTMVTAQIQLQVTNWPAGTNIVLTCSGSGLECSVIPSTLTATGSTSVSAILTIKTTERSKPGTYTVTVTASGAGLTSPPATFTVNVEEVPLPWWDLRRPEMQAAVVAVAGVIVIVAVYLVTQRRKPPPEPVRPVTPIMYGPPKPTGPPGHRPQVVQVRKKEGEGR